jgi:putative ABC transport system ATP-binding protein
MPNGAAEPAGGEPGVADAGVSVSDLRFAYPHGPFSLDIPRLEVRAGERLAVIGPSGCGKTTLLRLIAGILVPDAGRVAVGDVPVSTLGDGARRQFRIARLGLVFQSFALIEYLDVLDNILHCYRIGDGLALDAGVRDRARRLATDLGLGDKLGRKVGDLSAGERQRVAICRALLGDPAVLLADEATGNLDPDNKGRILDRLFERLTPGRSTLIAVTHDHELLDRFDRVVDLREFGAA